MEARRSLNFSVLGPSGFELEIWQSHHPSDLVIPLQLVFSNGYLTVNTKELTPSTSGVTKVYDGSTTVRGVSVDISGKVSGDEVIIGNSGGSFASKNVGSGINYTIYGLLMSGLDAGNYHLSTGSISGNGSITAKTLTASYSASNKVYDGSISATVVGSLNSVVSGDTVTLANTSATFADKNVGTGKTVTISGLSLGGTHVGNYTLSNTSANLMRFSKSSPLSRLVAAD